VFTKCDIDLVFMHFTILVVVVAIYRRRHIIHALHVGQYYYLFMSFVLVQAIGMFFLVNGVVSYFWGVVGFIYLTALILVLLRILFFTSESWNEMVMQIRDVYKATFGKLDGPSSSSHLHRLDSVDPVLHKFLIDKVSHEE
jgi:hypothetical protein